MAPANGNGMEKKTIVYWISSLLVCGMMLLAAGGYLSHQAKIDESFRTLGYPPYFQIILGIAKILGIIALLVPKFGLLKEWAYAGFTFTFIGAFMSHLAVGQQKEALMPVIALILLGLSYHLRPASRRLKFPHLTGLTVSPTN
jgi:hypothetical protein